MARRAVPAEAVRKVRNATTSQKYAPPVLRGATNSRKARAHVPNVQQDARKDMCCRDLARLRQVRLAFYRTTIIITSARPTLRAKRALRVSAASAASPASATSTARPASRHSVGLRRIHVRRLRVASTGSASRGRAAAKTAIPVITVRQCGACATLGKEAGARMCATIVVLNGYRTPIHPSVRIAGLRIAKTAAKDQVMTMAVLTMAVFTMAVFTMTRVWSRVRVPHRTQAPRLARVIVIVCVRIRRDA